MSLLSNQEPIGYYASLESPPVISPDLAGYYPALTSLVKYSERKFCRDMRFQRNGNVVFLSGDGWEEIPDTSHVTIVVMPSVLCPCLVGFDDGKFLTFDRKMRNVRDLTVTEGIGNVKDAKFIGNPSHSLEPHINHLRLVLTFDGRFFVDEKCIISGIHRMKIWDERNIYLLTGDGKVLRYEAESRSIVDTLLSGVKRITSDEQNGVTFFVNDQGKTIFIVRYLDEEGIYSRSSLFYLSYTELINVRYYRSERFDNLRQAVSTGDEDHHYLLFDDFRIHLVLNGEVRIIDTQGLKIRRIELIRRWRISVQDIEGNLFEISRIKRNITITPISGGRKLFDRKPLSISRTKSARSQYVSVVESLSQ